MEDKRTRNTVERPFQVIPTRFSLDSAPETVLDWLWVHPFITPPPPPLSLSPLPFPDNFVTPNRLFSTHFAQNATLFGV